MLFNKVVHNGMILSLMLFGCSEVVFCMDHSLSQKMDPSLLQELDRQKQVIQPLSFSSLLPSTKRFAGNSIKTLQSIDYAKLGSNLLRAFIILNVVMAPVSAAALQNNNFNNEMDINNSNDVLSSIPDHTICGRTFEECLESVIKHIGQCGFNSLIARLVRCNTDCKNSNLPDILKYWCTLNTTMLRPDNGVTDMLTCHEKGKNFEGYEYPLHSHLYSKHPGNHITIVRPVSIGESGQKDSVCYYITHPHNEKFMTLLCLDPQQPKESVRVRSLYKGHMSIIPKSFFNKNKSILFLKTGWDGKCRWALEKKKPNWSADKNAVCLYVQSFELCLNPNKPTEHTVRTVGLNLVDGHYQEGKQDHRIVIWEPKWKLSTNGPIVDTKDSSEADNSAVLSDEHDL